MSDFKLFEDDFNIAEFDGKIGEVNVTYLRCTECGAVSEMLDGISDKKPRIKGCNCVSNKFRDVTLEVH